MVEAAAAVVHAEAQTRNELVVVETSAVETEPEYSVVSMF